MHLFIDDREDREHRRKALENGRVMETVRGRGRPIKAESGDADGCSSCAISVDETSVEKTWLHRFVRATDEEMERLAHVDAAEAHSRLACQIRLTPELGASLVPSFE